MAADHGSYSTRPLSPDTWDDFARLVEANNGVWGGCWCMGFHTEGLKDRTAADNRAAKQAHVTVQRQPFSMANRSIRHRTEGDVDPKRTR